MAVQGHLVGPGRFGDCLNPDGLDPVAVKEVAGDRENALARGDYFVFPDSCGFYGGAHDVSS